MITTTDSLTAVERVAILFIKGSLIGYQQKVQDKYDLFDEDAQTGLFFNEDEIVSLPRGHSIYFTELGPVFRDDGSIYLIEIGDPDLFNDLYANSVMIENSTSGGTFIENYEDGTYVHPRQYQLPVALTHVRYVTFTLTVTFGDPDDPDDEDHIDRVTSFGGSNFIWINASAAYTVDIDSGTIQVNFHIGPFAGEYDASLGFESGSTTYSSSFQDNVNARVKKKVNPSDPTDGTTDDEDDETVFVVYGKQWIFDNTPEPTGVDLPDPPDDVVHKVIVGLGLWRKED